MNNILISCEQYSIFIDVDKLNLIEILECLAHQFPQDALGGLDE